MWNDAIYIYEVVLCDKCTQLKATTSYNVPCFDDFGYIAKWKKIDMKSAVYFK